MKSFDEYKILNNDKLKFDMNSRVLLLQGPIGNYFNEFSKFLQKENAKVFKINFTLAECFFYREKNSFYYKDKFDNWPDFFKNFIERNKINRVYMLNDSRPYHQSIIRICNELSVRLYVFEDGYFRPNYITLEPYGVNGNSLFRCFHNELEPQYKNYQLNFNLKNKFLSRLTFSLLSCMQPVIDKNYIAYRSLNPLYWLKKYLKQFAIKISYFYQDHYMLRRALKKKPKKIFFIPLQVFDDSQIKYHSKFSSNYDFINAVYKAFNNLYQDNDFLIIFKQHPGDQGLINYKKYILSLFNSKNVIFVFNIDANYLIDISNAVILINSTLGINAIKLNKKVFLFGSSVYESHCYSGDLTSFIQENIEEEFNEVLKNKKFLNKLKYATQVKSSFYK